MYVLSFIRLNLGFTSNGEVRQKIGFLNVFLNPQGIMPNVNLVTIPEVDNKMLSQSGNE